MLGRASTLRAALVKPTAGHRRRQHTQAGVGPTLFGGSVFGLALLSSLAEPKPLAQAEAAMLLKPDPLSTKYHVGGIIGSGGFARVCAGREKLSDTPVAIKKLSKALTSKARFEQEVSILTQVQGNDAVVQLKEAFETPEDYVLVTEYIQGGELFDRLLSHGTYSEAQAKALMREISSALQHLHAQNVVHADVKPENILLQSKNDSARMILIDFGLSFHVNDRTSNHRWDGSGTMAYAAPEVLKKETISSAIDMWALGVVLYVLLAGFHPFDPTNEASDRDLRECIIAGQYDFNHEAWTDVSNDAKDLIRQLLQVDACQRPSATSVLSHPWMQA
ncbi:CAMK protein kinase [Saprolegnia diclina VS20]|uniref:CAMK protein kinase n=1 Tax=Saprolegnia diclina (strain VS20) TaxID=1156394 RepID=T0QB89_SAPDV|nr:CAMK protein kinase [Saprolegnia diclina VS20]EQC30800.1 CAMK protein kinase [Saprolegnia diclina VS20]|eukprot:XP_008615824.1 CAMK protein kinase [Saprolegnia diclina VS20]